MAGQKQDDQLEHTQLNSKSRLCEDRKEVLVFINKKKKCCKIDFAVPTDLNGNKRKWKRVDDYLEITADKAVEHEGESDTRCSRNNPQRFGR